MQNRKAVGSLGESKAATYLEMQGFEVLYKNFRFRNGEIDIIVKKNDILAFVEVKTLMTLPFSSVEYLINAEKQKRIIETSKFFLSQHREYNNLIIRYDVIGIINQGRELVYLESAFLE